MTLAQYFDARKIDNIVMKIKIVHPIARKTVRICILLFSGLYIIAHIIKSIFIRVVQWEDDLLYYMLNISN